MKLSLYVKETWCFFHESQYWDPFLQVQVGFSLSFSLCRNLVVCHKYDMSFFCASTLWPMACFGWSSTHGMQHCMGCMITKVHLSECILQMVWYPIHSMLFCGIYIVQVVRRSKWAAVLLTSLDEQGELWPLTFLQTSKNEKYGKHKCALGYLRIRVEIFNYPVVLIDIMIVMPLEASLTNRSKPAATFVEDVLVHAHCWSTCTLFWCTCELFWVYIKLTQQCFSPYALLVHIHFFCIT